MDTKWGEVFLPFRPTLWLAVGCTTLVVAAALTVFGKLGRRFGVHAKPTPCFGSSLFLAYGIFCLQGVLFVSAAHRRPRSHASSLLHCWSYLVAIVLLTAYSSCLVSIRSIRGHKLPFTSLEEMLADGRRQIGVLSGGVIARYFQETNHTVARAAFQQMILPVEQWPLDDRDGLVRTCSQPGFSFFVSAHYVMANRLPCRVVRIPALWFKYDLALIYPRSSPFRKAIARKLELMRQAGILAVLYWHEWPVPVEHSHSGDLDSVPIQPVATLFLLLVAGILASLLFLLLEAAVQRWKFEPKNQTPHSIVVLKPA